MKKNIIRVLQKGKDGRLYHQLLRFSRDWIDRFFEFIHKIGYNGTFTLEATALDRNGVIDIDMLNKQFEFIRNAME